MEKKEFQIILCCLIGGIVITIITGLINITPPMYMGSSWYGFPLPWRYVIVADPPIESISLAFFFLDAMFWWFVLYAVILLIKKVKSKE